MAEKGKRPGQNQEDLFMAAVKEAAEVLRGDRNVAAEVWTGMVDRQQLGKESLSSKVQMSGPIL